MRREELIKHLEHLADYVKYSEDAPALREVIEMLKCSEMPNGSEERTEERTETHACDCIARQAAIDAVRNFGDCENGYSDTYDKAFIISALEDLPSAQPERLTDDDFETIRIHLNAYKEKLCNQRRWEEAEEYQRIIDRFMAFASAQPDLIRCKDCKYWEQESICDGYCSEIENGGFDEDHFCSYAERREDG